VRAHIKTFIFGGRAAVKLAIIKSHANKHLGGTGCFFPRPSLSRATSCACELVVQINGKKFSSGLYVQRSILDSLKCRPQVNLYPLFASSIAYLVLHLRVGTRPKPRANCLKTCVAFEPQMEKRETRAPRRCKTQCTAVSSSSHRDREPFCSSARNGF
jgi:hypothetical protein